MWKWGRISVVVIILIIGGVCLYWYMNCDLYMKDYFIMEFYEFVFCNFRLGIKKLFIEFI